MELLQQDLQSLGRAVADGFKKLVEAPWTDDQDTALPSRRRIADEEERFRLWARTLGLFQTGHASLDYRVRDASFIKASLTDILTELKHHVQNLLGIALGTRQPLERDEKARQAGGEKNDSSFSDDEASLGSSMSSIGSFQEAEFRLSSITTRLDSLYKLASRIRSPQNRQQRSTRDLYKHVPESQRAGYIQNQEQIEVSLVAYVQRQQLVEWVDEERLQELGLGQEELIAQYASANHWLIARTGLANARRKQQFIYWKKHAQLLGRNVTGEAPATTELPIDTIACPQSATVPIKVSKQAPPKSMATSVTKIDLVGLEDMRSVISNRSRVSTVASPRGEDLTWPPAPNHPAERKYFPCPYCGILCPQRYLNRDNWRVHQIHDLQPYHCTYEDCSDPYRLYGVRQEWIDHENQHRRVWHCHSHEVEFETRPEYLQHLEEQHPESKREDYTPEIIAAVVGASANPHRDCPFCPTTFSDVTMMQKHVRYHLERLALYALPDVREDNDDKLASERSSDSHQVIENRGRQNSIGNDFVEERQAFLAAFTEDDSGHGRLTKGGDPLSKVNLRLAQPYPPVSWLDTYLVSQRPASSGSDSTLEPYDPTLPSVTGIASQYELAIAYKANGQVKEAIKLLERVVAAHNETLAETHPDRLASQHALAGAYQANGRVREATHLLEHVVAIHNETLAETHPDRLASQQALAGAYQANGQVMEAIELLEHVVAIRKETLAVELDPKLYVVAWIAPLEIEAHAAACMLDREHVGRFPLQRGDDYVYQAGEICGHNVVIATLAAGQEYGTGSAAALASQVKKFFPNIWFGLLVGVAAGLPRLTEPSPRDIRLGDVLVALPEGDSAGLVAYDLGKETDSDGFQLLRGGHVLAVTETVVRAAIASIKAQAPDDTDLILPYYNEIKNKQHRSGTFADPGQDKDRFYGDDESGRPTIQAREPRPNDQRTRIWYGPIGSGDKLMKNALKRNELRDRYNIIGLEMEAAGTMNRIPVGVIRGVCDYGDEHKNKEWQPYAAAMAAAYGKAVLAQIGPLRPISS